MGDVVLFRSREKFMAEKAAKETPAPPEWASNLDFTGIEERAVAYACEQADVEVDKVWEIMQHDGCTLEAAIMAAGAKKRAGY